MSTGIKYYPESSESSYVSISFVWIKDQRLQGWKKPFSLGTGHWSFMTFPCTTELAYEPWTWGLFPHGGGVDESCQTFRLSQRVGCQGDNNKVYTWIEKFIKTKRTRSCNNGISMRHQDSCYHRVALRHGVQTAPFQAENGVLSTKDGLSVVMDFYLHTIITLHLLTFHLDPLIQQNWSLVE